MWGRAPPRVVRREHRCARRVWDAFCETVGSESNARWCGTERERGADWEVRRRRCERFRSGPSDSVWLLAVLRFQLLGAVLSGDGISVRVTLVPACPVSLETGFGSFVRLGTL